MKIIVQKIAARVSYRLLCRIILTIPWILAGCKDDDTTPSPNPVSETKTYVSFDLSVNYLDDFNGDTQTFALDDAGLAFISLSKMEAYKLKNGEAEAHQNDIDFVYQVSASGRTGYFSNTGYFKPTADGYQKSPFGPNWKTWNDASLIAAAHSLKKDPITGGSYSLSDAEFDAIGDRDDFGGVNFGNNPGVPLGDSQKLAPSARFDIWEDGTVEDNNYFVFTLGNGNRGIIKIRKDDDATALSISVKMLF